jgi:hypothetical protein
VTVGGLAEFERELSFISSYVTIIGAAVIGQAWKYVVHAHERRRAHSARDSSAQEASGVRLFAAGGWRIGAG